MAPRKIIANSSGDRVRSPPPLPTIPFVVFTFFPLACREAVCGSIVLCANSAAISPWPALVANSLCLGQEKRKMH